MNDLITYARREVTDFTIEFTLMHVARCEEVFQAARAHLLPEHFSAAGEVPHRIIWSAVLDYYSRHNALPSYNALSMRVLSEAQTMRNPVEHVLVAVNDIVKWMYDKQINPDEDLTPDEAIETLREILLDRMASHRLRQAVTYAPEGQIYNLPKLIENTQRHIETIGAIGRGVEGSTMPATWAEAGRPKVPTGVNFIDRVMEGGSEPGDVNVIIGATGGGKTTLAMQLAVSMAQIQRQIAERGNEGKPGLIVFVSYEDNMRMMQIRAASFAADVLKNRLRFLKDDDELSSKGNLEEYEHHMYSNMKAPEELLGERERLTQAMPWLNKYLRLIDFHDGASGGNGHVTEVRQRLMAIQEKADMPIRAVFMDWAGQMIRNYLLGQGKAVEGGTMSLELSGLVGRAKREIATPFDCTVWIPHQLAGRLTNRPPASVPHHSEAEWCSSFANNAWYAFCLGTKDEEHSVVQITATKTRHGEPIPPAICKLDGAFCRLLDVSDQFSRDPVSRRLVPTQEVEQYHENITTSRRGTENVHSEIMRTYA